MRSQLVYSLEGGGHGWSQSKSVAKSELYASKWSCVLQERLAKDTQRLPLMHENLVAPRKDPNALANR